MSERSDRTILAAVAGVVSKGSLLISDVMNGRDEELVSLKIVNELAAQFGDAHQSMEILDQITKAFAKARH